MSHSSTERIRLRDQMLAILSEAMKERSKRHERVPEPGNQPGGFPWTEPAWVAFERELMFTAVNKERSARGLAPVLLKEIMRVEQFACGHSDYSSKFALYCAELAQGLDEPAP